MRRSLEALLARGHALTLVVNKRLTQYIQGLADGAPEDFKNFAARIWFDLFPQSTNDVDLWAEQFGLFQSQNEATQRLNIEAAWKASGGQGLDYFQSVINAAGFTGITVHSSLDPDTQVYRNPLAFLAQSQDVGQIQAGGAEAYAGSDLAYAANLQEEIADHIVNLDLTFRPQPPISEDPATWPFWIYVGGEDFLQLGYVPPEREFEFQTLILSLFPGHYWIGYKVSTNREEVDDEYILNVLDPAGWWDPSTIVNNGSDRVELWQDRTANGNDLTNALTPPSYVAAGINARPSINAVGDEFLIRSTFTQGELSQPLEIFVVCSWQTAARFAFDSSASGRVAFGNNGSGKPAVLAASAFSELTGITVPSQGDTVAISLVVDGASTLPSFLTDANGLEVGGIQASPGTSGLNGLIVGSNLTSNQPWGENISEVLVFGAPLSPTDRAFMLDYLDRKYVISTQGNVWNDADFWNDLDIWED